MQIEFQNSDAAVESGGPINNHVMQVPDAEPRPWVQLTKEGLRIAPEGDHVAVFHDDYWRPLDRPNGQIVPGLFYSDVVIG